MNDTINRLDILHRFVDRSVRVILLCYNSIQCVSECVCVCVMLVQHVSHMKGKNASCLHKRRLVAGIQIIAFDKAFDAHRNV